MFSIILHYVAIIDMISSSILANIAGTTVQLGEVVKPMEQFEVRKIWDFAIAGIDLSITNSTLAMLGGVIIVMVIYGLLSVRRSHFCDMPTRSQAVLEMLYHVIHKMVASSIGHNLPVKLGYTKFIFSIFIFVLSMNLLGLIPFAFAPTAHIIVTFALAILVLGFVICVAIVKHGWYFFRIFIPHGIPVWMIPLMFALELFGYLAKPVSLSIRLAANMIAGHVMLEVLAFFTVALGIFGCFPMIFLIAVLFLEIFIAVLQAYIFALLSSIYLGEVLRH